MKQSKYVPPSPADLVEHITRVLSGAIYDLTGSYQAAFLNGIAWNLVNMSIAFWLLLGRLRPRRAAA